MIFVTLDNPVPDLYFIFLIATIFSQEQLFSTFICLVLHLLFIELPKLIIQ